MNTIPALLVDRALRKELADYMLSTATPADPNLPAASLLPQIERAISTMSASDIAALLTEMRMKRRPDARHSFDYDPCRSR